MLYIIYLCTYLHISDGELLCFSEAYIYIWVPVQASISLYLLYGLLGSSMFAGLAVLLFSIPTTLLMSRFSHKFRRSIMKIKDKRIKIINETLNAIKVSQSQHLHIPIRKKSFVALDLGVVCPLMLYKTNLPRCTCG